MEYPFEIRDIRVSNIEFIQIGPKLYAATKSLEPLFPKLYNFKTRPEDIWIYGFPRSGTTIMQEVVWLIENNLDFERAKNEILDLRFPVIERSTVFDQDNLKINDEHSASILERFQRPIIEELSKIQGGRLMKTHIPLSLGPSNLLQSGCKIIYIARDPKDVIVSNYNFDKDFKFWHEDFESFYNAFEAGTSYFCPYFEHIKEAWTIRNQANFLFLFYEDLNQNLRQSLIRISDFLGKTLTDKQLGQLEEHLKIDNFRKNQSVNNDFLRKLGIISDKDNQFIRDGKIGNWHDYFYGSSLERVDKWIRDNLKDTDIKFPSLQN